MENSVGAAALRSSLPRWARLALVLFAALLLSACEAELYNNLDQRQANEMVAALQQRGIPAQRMSVKGGQYTVMVDKGRFAETLAEMGIPHPRTFLLRDPGALEKIPDEVLAVSFLGDGLRDAFAAEGRV